MKLYFHMNVRKEVSSTDANLGILTAAVRIVDLSNSVTLSDCFQEVRRVALRRHGLVLDPCGDTFMLGNTHGIPVSKLVCAMSNSVDLYVPPTVRHKESPHKCLKDEETVVSEAVLIKKQVAALECNETLIDYVENEYHAHTLEAEKHEKAKRKDLALAIYQKILSSTPNDMHSLFCSAHIYMQACRYDESAQLFSKLFSLDPTNITFALDFARALTCAGRPSEAMAVLSKFFVPLNCKESPAIETKVKFRYSCAVAHVLEKLNVKEAAFDMYLSCARESNKEHLDAVIGYARLGYELRKCGLHDVFTVLVAAVGSRIEDIELKLFFSRMMKEPDALQCLISQLGDGVHSVAVLCAIAEFLRNVGCLEPCSSVLDMAMRLRPDDADTALLLMHVRENLLWYDEALRSSADFLVRDPAKQRMLRVDLSPIPSLVMNELISNRRQSYEMPEPDTAVEANPCQLSEVELRRLAIYLTLVKICFLRGYFRCLPSVLRLLDAICKRLKLGETLIRNENAYFACIKLILASCPPPAVSEGPFLYFVGDSHVLPAAWRNVVLGDCTYQVFPLLVTGVKIWHLREESLFYPKANFEAAVMAIPSGSLVVFALGEIDCREGVERAVQKCCYDTAEECILKLVRMYISILCELHDTRKFRIFVHPVPPVLEFNREITMSFNRILKRKLARQPTLKWLDFAEDLLANDGGLLRAYKFDGVHLHPSYLELLSVHIGKGHCS